MDRQRKAKFQKKWELDPNEKCPKDKMGNNKNLTCFVPSCCNQMWRKGLKNRRLLFFKVPNGIEGLLWTKAIKKMGRETFAKCVESLQRGESTKFFSHRSRRYCCEAHFDIRRDIERKVNANGSVEYRVKADVLPSVVRKQKERLIDMVATSGNLLDEQRSEVIIGDKPMTEESVIETDNSNESTDDAFTQNEESDVQQSYVYYEIRTLEDQQTETGCEQILQMLPLTIALMKRKSLHYTGLEPDRFLRLLELFKNRKNISEQKLMLTLRKLHLKEDFETLGDLFDLDKTTTEKYFNEAKEIVANFVGARPPTSILTAATIHAPVVPTGIGKNERKRTNVSSMKTQFNCKSKRSLRNVPEVITS